MRLKSYFAPTVEAAMAAASKELGEDALLVYAREATPETRYLGRHEVVFAAGVEEETVPASSPAPPRAPAASPSPTGVTHPWIPMVREQLGRIGADLRPDAGRGGEQHAAGRREDGSDKVLSQLTVRDIPELLIQAVIGRATTAAPSIAPESVAFVMTQMLAPGACGRTMLVLLGPPGAGKTLFAMKLASRRMSEDEPPPRLASLDAGRIGGGHRLRRFAEITGAEFAMPTNVTQLSDWLQQSVTPAIIDASGATDDASGSAGEMLEWLSKQPGVCPVLTLSACMRTADLMRVANRYGRFQYSGLAFSRLDETHIHGPVWALAVHTGKPVLFVSDGRRIPEDLSEPTPEQIVRLVLSSENPTQAPPRSFAAGRAG